MTVGVFVFELLNDFLLLAPGAVVYAYSWQWFSGRHPWDARLRTLLNGLASGVLAILLRRADGPDHADRAGAGRPRRAPASGARHPALERAPVTGSDVE